MLQPTAGLSSGAGDMTAVSLMLSRVGQQGAVLAFGDAYRITFVAAGVAFLLATLLPGRMTAVPNGAPLAH